MALPHLSPDRTTLLTLASLRQCLSRASNSVWTLRDSKRAIKAVVSPPIPCEGIDASVNVCLALGNLSERRISAWVETETGTRVGQPSALVYNQQGEDARILSKVVLTRLATAIGKELVSFYSPAVAWFDRWLIPSSIDLRSVHVISAVTGCPYVGMRESALETARQVLVWQACPGLFEVDADDVSVGEVSITWHAGTSKEVGAQGKIAPGATPQERALVFLAMIQHLRARVQVDHDVLASAYKFLIELGYVDVPTQQWSDQL